MGLFIVRAGPTILGVSIGAPDFWKLPGTIMVDTWTPKS